MMHKSIQQLYHIHQDIRDTKIQQQNNIGKTRASNNAAVTCCTTSIKSPKTHFLGWQTDSKQLNHNSDDTQH